MLVELVYDKRKRGKLMDTPMNNWTDIRQDMPSDSLFNQRMSQNPGI